MAQKEPKTLDPKQERERWLKKISRSKYQQPHQNERERERRQRQNKN